MGRSVKPEDSETGFIKNRDKLSKLSGPARPSMNYNHIGKIRISPFISLYFFSINMDFFLVS